jgi:hypothetical protein
MLLASAADRQPWPLRDDRVRDRVADAEGTRPLISACPSRAWFDVQLMHKDIRLALEAARQMAFRCRRHGPPTAR